MISTGSSCLPRSRQFHGSAVLLELIGDDSAPLKLTVRSSMRRSSENEITDLISRPTGVCFVGPS